MTTKATVLFVDDEERIVNLLKIMFRTTYNVLTATNGYEAIRMLQSQQVHVLVSDQRMPEMTGIDLLTKARECSPNTMRLLLTGYSDLAAILGSVNDGEVFRFLNKPWDQEEIKSIIADAASIALSTAANSAVQHTTNAALTAAVMQTDSRSRNVLVLDDNEFDRHSIIYSLQKEYRTHAAASIPDALKMLEQHDISVIIAEATVNGQSTNAFLNLLKKHYPLITTVMLTGAADSDMVVKLINQAQICRFTTKPIKVGAFSLAVKAAMMQHERFRLDPALMARHKVAHSEEAETSSLSAGFGRVFASLRSRFNFFNS
jgi:response regulator RpfG family c-di-GMP phosphodiesterase